MASGICAAAFGAAIACGSLWQPLDHVGAWTDVPIPSETHIPSGTLKRDKLPAKYSEAALHNLDVLSAGIPANEQQCKALATALWLQVSGRNFCVRYWTSGPIGSPSDQAIVLIHGDIGRRLNGKTDLEESAARVTDASVQRDVDALARMYPGFGFVIGRPGTFGSSGYHLRDRRTLLEIRVIAAALDALKARHGIKRFHFAGHSGGGHTVAGLAQTRSDIGCAVMTSGGVSVVSMHRDAGLPLPNPHSLYDPIDHVSGMKGQPGLRLFVVSDPDDKAVSFRSQREFVEKVKARGLPIVHITAAARDQQSHSLHAHGIRLAVDCAKGADDLEPAARYQTKIDCAAMRDALKLPADLPCERVLMINSSISRPMP